MECKNCLYFERVRWHKAIDPTESEQLIGKCRLLPKALATVNPSLWMTDYISVPESFGCRIGKEK